MSTTIDRSKTQVTSTKGTYEKVAQWISNDSEKDVRVLDFGAGLCHGKAILNSHPNIVAEDFEPFAKDDVTPDYTEHFQIVGKFDYLVNNCVLNVIEDRVERQSVVTIMIDQLAKNGKAIIMVRSWSAVKSNKTNIPHADGFVNSKGTFQRGFTTKELIELIESACDNVKVEKTNLGDTGVIVTRL